MCGIVGQITFVDKNGVAPDEAIVSRLSALMARRGPDDQGFWSDGRGFSQLSADYPFWILRPRAISLCLHKMADTLIVYNGEVYNFRELRHELRARWSAFSFYWRHGSGPLCSGPLGQPEPYLASMECLPWASMTGGTASTFGP